MLPWLIVNTAEPVQDNLIFNLCFRYCCAVLNISDICLTSYLSHMNTIICKLSTCAHSLWEPGASTCWMHMQRCKKLNLLLVGENKGCSGSRVFTRRVISVNWTSGPSGQSRRIEWTNGLCRALLRSERRVVDWAQKAQVRHDEELRGGRAGSVKAQHEPFCCLIIMWRKCNDPN